MTRSAKRVNVARSLRRKEVPAEAVLWKALRDRALAGFKFRRQHPIGLYIVDFACVACKIVIELDGESHLVKKPTDAVRSKFLESDGWQVLRFWNPDVYDDLETVKEAIYQACAQNQLRV